MAGESVVAVWSGAGPVSRDFRIPAEGLVLGRELLPDTTDDRLSRVHARVLRVGEQLIVSDAGSRNGTYLYRRPLEKDTAIVDGAVIRTGRTVWVLVANLDQFDGTKRIQAMVDAVRTVAPDLSIHATVPERCLIAPPTHRKLLEAASARARDVGVLRGEDLEEPATPPTLRVGDTHAVFPGPSLARAVARDFAGKLAGATTRDLGDGNTLVDARRGDRQVTIVCPPSTAFLVELYEGESLVATGDTLERDPVVAMCSAWLDGASLVEVTQDSSFLVART